MLSAVARMLVMSSQRWVQTYAIDSAKHPLYIQYCELYHAFFKRGVASVGESEWQQYVPTHEHLAGSGEFVNKGRHVQYGGRTELWILAEKETGAPMAFITAQHFIPYARWRQPTHPEIADKVPEMVYIAHFGSVRGAGKRLLDELKGTAWEGVVLLLEIENTIENAEGLIKYYEERAGFVLCEELSYENFWRFFLRHAARNNFFQVRVRGETTDLKLLDGHGDVCAPNGHETFMLYDATPTPAARRTQWYAAEAEKARRAAPRETRSRKKP